MQCRQEGWNLRSHLGGRWCLESENQWGRWCLVGNNKGQHIDLVHHSPAPG